MNEQKKHNQEWVTRFRRFGMLILIVGWLGAALVYFFASETPLAADGYQIIDGVSYPIDVNNTKIYNDQMERINGKSGVVASELGDWFSSLWHGKKLACTLVGLSVVVSLLCFWLAHLVSLPPLDNEPDRSDWKG
jgi:hypothetical protein